VVCADITAPPALRQSRIERDSLISQVLPESEKRPFNFEGVLEEALMFEGKTTVLTKELQAIDCPEPSDH
jgi:hypothetical protein